MINTMKVKDQGNRTMKRARRLTLQHNMTSRMFTSKLRGSTCQEKRLSNKIRSILHHPMDSGLEHHHTNREMSAIHTMNPIKDSVLVPSHQTKSAKFTLSRSREVQNHQATTQTLTIIKNSGECIFRMKTWYVISIKLLIRTIDS
jgi:hypothetical protein